MRDRFFLAATVLTLLAVAAPSWADRPRRIFVPSDSKAAYYILENTSTGGSRRIVVTQRDGPSGRSYARREIDCRTQSYRYLGEGDTLQDAQRDGPRSQMGPTVAGSISDVVLRTACAFAAPN